MTYVLTGTTRTSQDIAATKVAAAQARIAAAINAHVEARAIVMGYNSAAHLAGYTGSTVSDWAEEARTFVAWRDAVWLMAFDLRDQYDITEDLPDSSEVLSHVPAWPG
ncbi:hypothetical protein [Pararhodobacter sp. CCB-MM2]|uniref:hypothetical protein n=1 Tax=Pararhodobacter sp. CCB-MM2 TaxID=1786003 RepID=UPI00083360E8|nr:hypothetical protein [Pararhodobacter sp. CCB-MM2]